MHRFFISADLLASAAFALPPEVAGQVTRVLRLRSGQRVVLFCGDGGECEAVLEEVESRGVRVRLVERRIPDVELRCALHVAVAALKGEKLDWTVQKLTELGAARISLLLTERTIVSAGEERWSRRMERYQRIAREAAEQSGRVRVPALTEPRKLEEVLVSEPSGALRVFLDPRAPESLLRSLFPCPPHVLLLIGPEGGFTGEEQETARSLGALPRSLGRRVLRAETAAIAAAALVSAAAEEVDCSEAGDD